jgi:hypothetical protein
MKNSIDVFLPGLSNREATVLDIELVNPYDIVVKTAQVTQNPDKPYPYVLDAANLPSGCYTLKISSGTERWNTMLWITGNTKVLPD